VFNIRAIDVSYFSKKIGKIDKKILAKIRAQARKLIG